MNELDLYRISDVYSLTDAAALLVGTKPSAVQSPSEWTRKQYYITAVEDSDSRPQAFDAALRALIGAVSRERSPLRATKWFHGMDAEARSIQYELPEGHELVMDLDPARTTVEADDLRQWLIERGVRTGFFFPDVAPAPDYLDPNHPRFAPKLAAAVKVWLAMEDENLRRTKGAVDAMKAWLETRYKELGLYHERDVPKNDIKAGDMNRTAIEEAAKVANWRPTGGAVGTPSE
ncbi:hypothetical protein WK39_03155 [Burkholderia cepacia]|uniref:hypothetical protein n=1 Tax=Burkholderia cepacia TaxID=292 RepID=UPI000755B2E3|nr:hypothetical protein [Burkholderia cepacia]KVS53289.1 hypothetical protein WK39_03155 [Burkholderia cepacia]KVS57753.1 hypothetical protein WK40_25605 [Burkholderia cepacia]CAG9269011.1 conserved hypothetical protein [Burkholderia cepacia]